MPNTSYISDDSVFATLQADLGGADQSLQSVLGGGGSTALTLLSTIRDADILPYFTTPDFTNITTLEGSIRTTVTGLPGTIGNIPQALCQALDNYFIQTKGMKLRLFWNNLNISSNNTVGGVANGNTTGTPPSWNTYFLAMWRRVMNEEIITKVTTFTNTTGTWANTTLGTWVLPTALQIRITSSETVSSTVSIPITATLADGVSTTTFTISVPANTGSLSLASVNNGAKYTAVTVSSTVTGGSDGDVIELWLA